MTASDSPNLTLTFKVTLEEVKKYSYEKKFWVVWRLDLEIIPGFTAPGGWDRKIMEGSPRSSGGDNVPGFSEPWVSRRMMVQCFQVLKGRRKRFQVFLPIILFSCFVVAKRDSMLVWAGIDKTNWLKHLFAEYTSNETNKMAPRKQDMRMSVIKLISWL